MFSSTACDLLNLNPLPYSAVDTGKVFFFLSFPRSRLGWRETTSGIPALYSTRAIQITRCVYKNTLDGNYSTQVGGWQVNKYLGFPQCSSRRYSTVQSSLVPRTINH